MFSVRLYSPEWKTVWDAFISQSKNGTFMLGRSYLEYHADRFEDFSLMLYEDDLLRAVLPASRHGQEIRSHGGLTYGGLVYDLKMTAQLMLECFDAIQDFLADQEVKRLLYKRIPYIYNQYPSDEDLYALFIKKGVLIRRDISSCIFMADHPEFSARRRRNIKKAQKAGLVIRQSLEYEAYMSLLTSVLAERHGAAPVHTAAEMEYLARLHPENIKLFAAYRGEEMLAGTIIYETPLVAHTQYLGSSNEGRAIGALDLVIDHLVNEYYRDKRYFDFGISTEHSGLYLNEGLITQKQEFGGRGVVHEFYELSIPCKH